MVARKVTMLDELDKQHVLAGAFYAVICFFSFPFIMLLLKIDLNRDPYVESWFEILFHVVNLLVVGSLFRRYLSDSLLNVEIHTDQFITVVTISVGLMLGIGFIWHVLYLLTGSDWLVLAGFGTIPLSEMDVFVLCADVVLGNKLFGTLCMVLVVPLTTSCLYYAVGFVPAYNVRPWLGYLVTAAAVAFPRICNALTYWYPEEELVLYLAQLPVHLVACWSYKKMDSIWAPITSIAITNLISSVLLMLFYAL